MSANLQSAANPSLSLKKRILPVWNQLGMLIILVLLCVVLALFAPYFTETNNILNILKQSSITAILAAGMTMVILTGGIDLSVGATLALAGVISVMLSNAGVPAGIAMLTGAAVGYTAGAVNGYFTAVAKLPSFVVTLGSMTYLRGIAFVISGGLPVVLQDKLFIFFGSGSLFGIPTPIYIMAVVYIAMFFVLKYTLFGRHVYAIGGNEEAARLTGIKVERTLIHVYSISGLMAGIAGVVMAGRVISGQPNAGISFELDAIAAVILGGTSFVGGVGRIQGTIIGVLIMAVLGNGLTLLDVDYYWQLIVKGLVIVIAVLLDKLRN
ncbi:ABC transporter permease subunit [Paenibacillus mucilaginosus]|uniref:Monosaccharide-transporting ATPase n=3 Tax=Paenibacillus mucilaginosus TaxID=61624 RepID=H6NJB2_9BACL|nr:ribose ABC transporter permease [Paenibacillus mucilaginosus]AEI40568.1 Monosaccharide-transporting ATPase [Paenibacillus mucilaginosus KNP414]AFC29191.1 Monosaccharide-transporting ATPase [Paenibacillus mucilaginosus 3016]AFH61364.1 ribose ABC transporter permease [Paenibacillus mucilaginosus K02]MCG7216298.1 ribose ABC transporter permease [Paenibacillus mucilaginosus]WDM29726.1 ribose ABC transporter permease [Paenibacillus mucilaginosus]